MCRMGANPEGFEAALFARQPYEHIIFAWPLLHGSRYSKSFIYWGFCKTPRFACKAIRTATHARTHTFSLFVALWLCVSDHNHSMCLKMKCPLEDLPPCSFNRNPMAMLFQKVGKLDWLLKKRTFTLSEPHCQALNIHDIVSGSHLSSSWCVVVMKGARRSMGKLFKLSHKIVKNR